MSITDELREWTRTNTVNCSDNRIALVGIAERIDAEHKRMYADLTVGMEPMTEESMAEHGWVKLPKDADGVTIRIGDILDPPTDCPDYSPLQVMRLTFDGYEDEWFFDGEAGGFTGMTGVHMDMAGWTHHNVQPDSWESIIEDAQADGVRYHNDGKPSDFDALVERCKRLAGEGV